MVASWKLEQQPRLSQEQQKLPPSGWTCVVCRTPYHADAETGQRDRGAMTTWLHERRLEAVLSAVRDSGASTILDLGCGDGALLTRLAREPAIMRVVGIDMSAEALHRLQARLDEAPAEVRGKVELIQGSLTEPGEGLAGFDAAVLVETIEHIDPARLSVVERAVFRQMRPATVLITTPNCEFNRLLGVPSHRFRHPEHRFEWGRAKFRSWAEGVARRNDYSVSCRDVAGAHPLYGGPTQMALFRKPPIVGDRMAA